MRSLARALVAEGGYEASWEQAAALFKKSAAIETVNPMLDPDGVWRVSGYFVR